MPAPLTKIDRDAWQAHLGLTFPAKVMLRPDEVATVLGVDPRTVARLFEVDGRVDGIKRPWLHGIEFSAGDGDRMARRIPRDAAILFWALSANYQPAEFLSLLLDVLERRSPAELAAIHQRAAELLRRATR